MFLEASVCGGKLETICYASLGGKQVEWGCYAEGQEEKGEMEDELVGWHHRLDGHEFEQTPGDSEGQGSLACCSPQGHKHLDTT